MPENFRHPLEMTGDWILLFPYLLDSQTEEHIVGLKLSPWFGEV